MNGNAWSQGIMITNDVAFVGILDGDIKGNISVQEALIEIIKNINSTNN